MTCPVRPPYSAPCNRHVRKLPSPSDSPVTPSTLQSPLYSDEATMSTTAPRSSPSFSAQKPPYGVSGSKLPSNLLTTKPKTLLEKHPLRTPTHSKTPPSIQGENPVPRNHGRGLRSSTLPNLSRHTASLHYIHEIITFLQSKCIHQKDLDRIFGMCPQILNSTFKADLNPVFNFISYDLKVPN
ncbi:unnamed protein product [Fraxinus pennsylvanica]|uniref:Uncharacterized protein n=1 Tax=Fraxinus pennsylvanica TaxID=56036 RepID=A0AAD1YZM3_9LAMI|nr:unnamed protein product [Fraxinus pennsylvanica]